MRTGRPVGRPKTPYLDNLRKKAEANVKDFPEPSHKRKIDLPLLKYKDLFNKQYKYILDKMVLRNDMAKKFEHYVENEKGWVEDIKSITSASRFMELTEDIDNNFMECIDHARDLFIETYALIDDVYIDRDEYLKEVKGYQERIAELSDWEEALCQIYITRIDGLITKGVKEKKKPENMLRILTKDVKVTKILPEETKQVFLNRMEKYAKSRFKISRGMDTCFQYKWAPQKGGDWEKNVEAIH